MHGEEYILLGAWMQNGSLFLKYILSVYLTVPSKRFMLTSQAHVRKS